jgi:hypothetical protein
VHGSYLVEAGREQAQAIAANIADQNRLAAIKL